jgi:hypothetical protein
MFLIAVYEAGRLKSIRNFNVSENVLIPRGVYLIVEKECKRITRKNTLGLFLDKTD